MEEGLLLDGIALDAAYVPPRDIQFAAAVVADLADAGLAFRDGAGVSAGVAAEAVSVELLDQLGRSLADVRVEDVFECGHLMGILLL
jgi:hypothetical protein